MSRHQALKSETHDFLLSLVKTNGQNNMNPAQAGVHNAYQNCFANAAPMRIESQQSQQSSVKNKPSYSKPSHAAAPFKEEPMSLMTLMQQRNPSLSPRNSTLSSH